MNRAYWQGQLPGGCRRARVGSSLWFCVDVVLVWGPTSETTSWVISLWIAARHSWVILGSLVPHPMRKGCTTSELFSFRAAAGNTRA
jgi:hypothetical protein